MFLAQGDTGSFDWNPFNRGPASAQPRPGRESEPFYGFGEFWKDLEKDLADRRQRRGGQPQSLLAELAELGEEFVEFLEQATRCSSPFQHAAPYVACIQWPCYPSYSAQVWHIGSCNGRSESKVICAVVYLGSACFCCWISIAQARNGPATCVAGARGAQGQS